MGRNLYIADLHFGHENIIPLDNRPFKNTEEMAAALVRNWQKAVKDDDVVYVVGDMFWKTVPGIERARILESLPGAKVLIRGNHDGDIGDGWAAVEKTLSIKDGRRTVYLNHYPCIAFPGFYDGDVHLYAHVHASYEANLAEKSKELLEGLYGTPCRMYNVGCMMPWMAYTPRTLDEIETAYAKCRLNAAYGYKPETCSMLTLSTGHVSEATAEMLEREGDLNAMGVSVYPKDAGGGEKFGWYVYLPCDCTQAAIPDDLKRCLSKARALGCSVLCLDCDGPEDPELETYDW